MQAEPDDEALWTIDECAAFLQIAPKTLRRHQQRGRIPYRKVIGLIRFVPAEIRAWVDEQTVSA